MTIGAMLCSQPLYIMTVHRLGLLLESASGETIELQRSIKRQPGPDDSLPSPMASLTPAMVQALGAAPSMCAGV